MNQLWEVGAEPISNVVAAQMRLLRRKIVEEGCDRLIETVYGKLIVIHFSGSKALL